MQAKALVPLLAGSILLPLRLDAQQERYAVTGNEVAIYNLAGEVQVQPGPGPNVTAEVTRGGADASKLKVTQGEIDGRQTLRFLYPADRIHYGEPTSGTSTQLGVRDNGTFGDNDRDDRERRKPKGKQITISSQPGGLDAHADLRIAIPNGRQVALYLGVGKVSVTNLNGDLDVDVAAGPVTSSNTRGELDIDVGSGAVQVTTARGDLKVDTGSGGVSATDVRGETVTIETGSGAVTSSDIRSSELSIETGSGDIEVTKLMAPHVRLETGSGSVTADLNGEVWNVGVQTGSGDVTLKMPPTIGAEVDIETSSGDIETDFEVAVTRHARDHMTGRIGDGRGKIAIETGSGGIKLVKGGS